MLNTNAYKTGLRGHRDKHTQGEDNVKNREKTATWVNEAQLTLEPPSFKLDSSAYMWISFSKFMQCSTFSGWLNLQMQNHRLSFYLFIYFLLDFGMPMTLGNNPPWIPRDNCTCRLKNVKDCQWVPEQRHQGKILHHRYQRKYSWGYLDFRFPNSRALGQ